MRASTGATMAEALVAVGIGFLVIGGALMVVLSLRKMGHSSELSGALQEAALAMTTVQRDLVQAVHRPDPAADSPVMVTPKSFQMIRGALRPGGAIEGERIVYRKEPTGRGETYRLRRDAGGKTSLVPGVFKKVWFAEIEGDSGPFVRATMILEVHEGGAQECLLSSLVRVCGPEDIRSQAFDWKFMAPLLPISFLGL